MDTTTIAVIVYSVTLFYSIFMTYLGWKQAKVYDQLDKVIKLLEQIKDKK